MSGSGLQTIFGDRTEELRGIIMKSVQGTHDVHVDGQQIIDPKGSRAYGGSIWVKMPNDLCDAVRRTFVDASVWQGSRAGYSLPVLDGCVLYAWRVPGGKSAKEVSFLSSGVREDLVDGVRLAQPTLFEGYRDEPDEGEEEVRELASEVAEGRLKLILIAVESTPERLSAVTWGEVKRGQGTELGWPSEEILYTFEEDQSRPVPVPERTFADGLPPAPFVMPRIEANNSDE